MKDTRDDEIEIDLLQLFWVMKRRLWIMILAVVVGAAAAMLYTTTLVEPVYTSSTMIYILNKTNNITSLSDLQLGTQLTKDYKVLVTSRPVLEQVTENLGLNLGYQQLNGKITVNNPTDTRIQIQKPPGLLPMRWHLFLWHALPKLWTQCPRKL